MTDRPQKRQRGSYAKLICLRCRERRIKCQIPEDVQVEPSPDPQPPEKACERCRQRGLECIIRRTTLGRPTHRQKALATAAAAAASTVTDGDDGNLSRSQSPEVDDLVLLSLEDNTNSTKPTRRKSSFTVETGAGALPAVMRAVSRNFDLTSSLLARDPRFGSALIKPIPNPRPLEKILDDRLAEVLDQHLVWIYFYLPWMPRLPALRQQLLQNQARQCVSTRLTLALLASIALDMPSDRITQAERQYQSDLQSIIKHVGQEVLLTLPRHRHTVAAMLLVHAYRPLALVDSQSAAVHTLDGTLYRTLATAVQRQLDVHRGHVKLRQVLDGRLSGLASQYVTDALQWCSALVHELDVEVEEENPRKLEESEQEMEDAFSTLEDAIDGALLSLPEFFLFHLLRCTADRILTMKKLMTTWTDLDQLTVVIKQHEEVCTRRRSHLERILEAQYCQHGRTEEALAAMQILAMEANEARTTMVGLSMFFAIISALPRAPLGMIPGQKMALHQYYTNAIQQIGQDTTAMQPSDVYSFLDQYANIHMDGYERQLSDFINLATSVKLGGLPFYHLPRYESASILMACKSIVENNAVSLRLDGEFHPRLEVQLILFQETARRLEALEYDGDTPEAIARGSMFSASAKLVRSLHRILSQWKLNEMSKLSSSASDPPSVPKEDPPSTSTPAALEASVNSTQPPAQDTIFDTTAMDTSAMFSDDFFADWDNWPQLNASDLAYSFPFDADFNNF